MTIPIINFYDPDVEEKMYDAFTTTGVASLSLVPWNWKPDFDALHEKTQEFFALPMKTKKKYSQILNFKNIGYIWPEQEKLVIDNPGDMKETFNFVDISKMPEQYWPKEVVGFKEYADRIYRISTLIAYEILYKFESILKIPKGHFVEKHLNAINGMRLIHYPGWDIPIKENQLRCGEHSDFDTISILYNDDCEGLQIYYKDEWIDVPVVENSIIVQVADMFQRWSNDLFYSAPHRVINKSMNRSRYTIAHFIGPARNTMIENLTDEPAKHDPISSADYLEWRYKKQFLDPEQGGLDKETSNPYHDWERVPEHDTPHYWR